MKLSQRELQLLSEVLTNELNREKYDAGGADRWSELNDLADRIVAAQEEIAA